MVAELQGGGYEIHFKKVEGARDFTIIAGDIGLLGPCAQYLLQDGQRR